MLGAQPLLFYHYHIFKGKFLQRSVTVDTVLKTKKGLYETNEGCFVRPMKPKTGFVANF